jgi:purine catabolism regulator
MPATAASLLQVPSFHLTVIAGVHGEDALDREIAWAHSSDLLDPTPWLEDGQLLLTDGIQFLGNPGADVYDGYVQRLIDRNVVALGFGIQIAHDTIPEPLVRSCERLGLPLLQVANRAPFMAIIRYVADVISAEQRGRLEWLLGAQRAVARAALRPNGLDLILRELEKQLDCWVELYDARGTRVQAGTQRRISDEIERQVTSGAREVLRKQSAAGMRVETTSGGATLQTLGQRGQLLGVLAVGAAAPLDPAEADLVSSVISLASIALEQSRALETARLRVRAGVLQLLLGGFLDVAADTAERLWGTLPPAPLRVAVTPRTDRTSPALLSDLELRAERNSGRLFFAERDGEIVAITPEGDVDTLIELLSAHGAEAGISAAIEWSDLQRGMTEAARASQRTLPSRPVVMFESLAQVGVLGLLSTVDPEPVARRMLAPITDSANPDHKMLLHSAAVWLEHNGAWDPAARALSVHRHTLRNRLRAVEELLAVDLSRFADRAELWAALQYADYPGKLRAGRTATH